MYARRMLLGAQSATGAADVLLPVAGTMLTDLDAGFRSLKGELGLRPIFHSKQERTEGHLFISVLAYQFFQTIRQRLKAYGIQESWAGLREILTVQRRVTASFTQKDGRTLHAQGHPPRARSLANLSGSWSSPSTRRRSETHLLTRANATVVPLAKVPPSISLMCMRLLRRPTSMG
jgi:hypothetical protein